MVLELIIRLGRSGAAGFWFSADFSDCYPVLVNRGVEVSRFERIKIESFSMPPDSRHGRRWKAGKSCPQICSPHSADTGDIKSSHPHPPAVFRCVLKNRFHPRRRERRLSTDLEFTDAFPIVLRGSIWSFRPIRLILFSSGGLAHSATDNSPGNRPLKDHRIDQSLSIINIKSNFSI